MSRRDLIAMLGGAAVSPLAVRAQQQPVMPMIGFLTSISPRAIARRLQVFRQALEETGYVEGRNVAIEYRWADGDYGRLPSLADELARLNVTVIVATGGTTSALAAKRATSIIPIVFTAGGDPVKSGLVASLNRPGGNITGVNVLASDLAAKRLELLQELVPKATVIAMLTDRNSATAEVNAAAVQEAARRFDRQMVVVKAGAESEFETAFATLVQQRVGALLVDGDPGSIATPVGVRHRNGEPSNESIEMILGGSMHSPSSKGWPKKTWRRTRTPLDHTTSIARSCSSSVVGNRSAAGRQIDRAVHWKPVD